MHRFLPKKGSLNSGQSLIGIIIALAIFSILASAILTVVSSSFRFVSFNRARITARHLAQEKIEFIRNLPYDDVGTLGGIPPGSLPQQDNIVRNKLNYLVKTAIVYVDNPFDGTVGGTPLDTLGSDYKRVRVEVSWEGLTASRGNPVVLLTDIVPKGIETSEGGGTLSIIVFDSNGDPVPQAALHIVQTQVAPNIDVNFQSADNGRFIFSGIPACVACYEITATKTNFSSERTYSVAEVANPTKPHQTILEGELTEISFQIDLVSTLNIATLMDRENNFAPLPSINFQLRGEKTIGTDASALPVYKYDNNLATDTSGNLALTDIEWDNYHFILVDGSTYDISGSNPFLPINILPDTSNNLSVALTVSSINNLLLSFVDTSDVPIASASATLTNGSYSETIIAGTDTDPDWAQTFFANLQNVTYTLQATVSGFLDYNASIPVSEDTTEKIILTPQ